MAPVNLQNAESVREALLAGAAANRTAICRQGSIDSISAPGRMIATGDLHDNPMHLAKLVEVAALGESDAATKRMSDGATEQGSDEGPAAQPSRPSPSVASSLGPSVAPPTHLVLHEIIHSDRLMNGMDFSYRALAKVAALKAAHPERVHVLLANHELAQVVGAGIVKDGVKVVEAFNAGVEYVFGEEAPAVQEAIGEFIRSMPLALRCHCGPAGAPGPSGEAGEPRGAGPSRFDILCAHSLPSPALMSRFDPTVLSRDLTEADYEPRQGAAHLMVWGRGYDAELIEDLVERWGVNMFILGHEKVEEGVRFIPPCVVVLNSDHERGVYLPIDLERPVRAEEAVGRAVRLA